MVTYIFTEDMYDRLREKSYDILSEKNNKIVYDLLLDDVIAVPENEYYNFTIPIMISKGKEFFIAEVNKKATLNNYFSEMEIALGSRIIKNERIRDIAKRLFTKNNMRNYEVIKEIVEENDYNPEVSIGRYSAWLDARIQGEIREVMG